MNDRRIAGGWKANQLLPIVLVMATAFSAGCGKDKNTYTPPPPPEVTVSKPVRQIVSDFAEFTGNTQALEFVEIRARVEGFLQRIHFTTSARVKKGDLLFVIDPRPYQAELDQAKADLKIKLAELKLAEVTLQRKKSAYQDRAISEVEVLEAQAHRDKVLAAIDASKAIIEKAALQLSYTQVVAPISGRAGRNLIDVGNLVGAGGDKTLLTTIVNDDSIYAYFNIGERDLLDFEQRTIQEETDREKRIEKPIYPVFLGLQNEAGFPHEGKIDFIANQMDPDTGTIEMRGVFPNPDGKLRSGLFARLKIPIGLPAEKLLVPERAIGADQRGRYLLAVSDDNEVQYKPIQLGTLVDDLQVVEKGVGPDDRIIVTGLLRVRPGLKVTPKEASTPPADSAGGAKSP